jgi:transposase
MKKLFIGIDISKDVFDCCLLDDQNQLVEKNIQFFNSKKGIQEFCTYLDAFNDYTIWVCMEHTGHFGAFLAFKLTEEDICFSIINPLEVKHSVGLTRGKTDPIDAYRIAAYALSNQHRIKPYLLPGKQLQKLKSLISIRRRYTKINVQLKNGLKALEILSKTVNLKQQIKDSKALIKKMESAILKVGKQMNEIVNSSEQLSESYRKITQIIGVGPITAITCIVETNNFVSFTKGRKFSCHCGLAPFKYQSGSSIKGKTRTSALRNKDLKSILFKAATTAIQHDPQLKNYYNRKLETGKHKLSVLNAVANKIVLRIFAVVMREEPFVKFSA